MEAGADEFTSAGDIIEGEATCEQFRQKNSLWINLYGFMLNQGLVLQLSTTFIIKALQVRLYSAQLSGPCEFGAMT